MFEVGFAIVAAFVLLWIKLPLTVRLKALGRPFLLDLTVSVGVFIMFGGTGAGLAAATVAGLTLSVLISSARKMYGYYEFDKGEWWYVRGKIDQVANIADEKARKIGYAELRKDAQSS
jgi:hypothetical protein